MTKPAERRRSAPGPIHRKARPIAKSSPRSTAASDCDRNDGKEFPSPEDRTFCIKLLENYDAPSYDPRRPSIKAWRDKLLDSERAKINHAKPVWNKYWSDTEPMAEKAAKRNAREMKAKADPVGDLAANQEVELKTKQRQFEAMREPFAYIRDHCDIPDDVAAKIDGILREFV